MEIVNHPLSVSSKLCFVSIFLLINT